MSAVLSSPQPLEPHSIEWKVARAKAALTQLLLSGAPVSPAWSAGKDSACVLNLLLTAAADLRRQGFPIPPIIVTHANTGIENPSMVAYARREMTQVLAFATNNGLDVRVETAHPNLNETWPVRVIGGRALPSFPSGSRDCTRDYKVNPMRRLRKSVLKMLQADESGVSRAEPVVLLGLRYDESSTRGANMRERGESDIQVRRGIDENGKPSHLFLSPICWWSTDDVWEYLGSVRGGLFDGYSTFEETMRVYADAMGVSCVIVAEDMRQSLKAKACGARHGCSLCTVADRDASMENMLARDPRYEYMRPLNQLRNFLSATRWDMDRRSWLGRTIKQGYVRIGPDAYSPSMMEELLRYALTIDVQEQQASRREGVRPRFQLVSIEQLFAIDAMWSLQAFHRPFHALAVWDDIHNKGARYQVPEVPTYVRPKELPERYFFVGEDWEDGVRYAYTGLRSVIHEMTANDAQDGCMGTHELADGRSVLDVNTGSQLEFDVEGCCFVLDDLPRLLRDYHDKPAADPTHAYFYYATLGIMSVKSGMQREIDEMLRRSSWKVRQGVAGEVEGRALWDRGVSREEAGMMAARTTRVRGAAGSLSVAHSQLIPAIAPAPTSQVRERIELAPTGQLVPAMADANEQLVFWMEQVHDEAEEAPAMRVTG